MRTNPVQSATDNVNKKPGLENGRHLTGKGYIYLRDGLKHRDKGPAEVHNDGYQAYYYMGAKHRVGGPAVVYPNGREEWWEKGKLLRVTNPEGVPPGTKVNLQGTSQRRLRKGP